MALLGCYIRVPLLIIILAITIQGISQEKGDSKIVVTISDTANLYERIKQRLIKADFAIKETGNKDTILTYPRELKTVSGYAVFQAVLNKNQVIFSGFYTQKRTDFLGYDVSSKGKKTIAYYKGYKTWKFLHDLATSIGGELSYRK